MNRFRQYLTNKEFGRISFFIVFTAALLYILFCIINEFPLIATTVLGALYSIFKALSPLWIGLILAYILNPLVELVDRKLFSRVLLRTKKGELLADAKVKSRTKRSRLLSILITYLLVFAIIVFLLYIFAAMILGEFVVKSIPDLFNSFVSLADSYEAEFKAWIAHLPEGALSDYANKALNSALRWISEHFSPSGIIDKVTGLGSGILNAFLGIVVSIYVVADKDFLIRLWNKILNLVMPKQAPRVKGTLSDINNIFSKFIRGVLIDALCVALLSSIGLSLMGLQFAVLIGVFAGISNVIPYFGPIIGMVPAFIVGLFTDNIWAGILAVVILFAVQQIDSNLIYPKVVGSSTGLKPLFVLLAVSVGGYYGGILGMVLAVPLASVLQLFARKWALRREKKLEEKAREELEYTQDLEEDEPRGEI